MEKQQQWVKDIIFSIIRQMQKKEYNGDFDTVGYTYTINAALDNYPQIYWNESKKQNVGMFHMYHKFAEKEGRIYQNVLMSKEAYNCMKHFSEENFKDPKQRDAAKKELAKKLHGEHLTPQSYTRHKLNDLLNSTKELPDEELKEKIQYALADSKLCIITKNESKNLDGASKRFSKKEIQNFLDAYEKSSGSSITEDMKLDFWNLEGKLKKSFGFGSIRMYVLLENGVIFVNDKGEKKSFKECIEYLNDGNYSVGTL